MKNYIKPEIEIINFDDLEALLRCACSSDDTNPY